MRQLEVASLKPSKLWITQIKMGLN